MADLAPTFSTAGDVRTVECPACGAHVMPAGRRVGSHNEQRVRVVRDERGQPVRDHLGRLITEVYVAGNRCDGSLGTPVAADGTIFDGGR